MIASYSRRSNQLWLRADLRLLAGLISQSAGWRHFELAQFLEQHSYRFSGSSVRNRRQLPEIESHQQTF